MVVFFYNGLLRTPPYLNLFDLGETTRGEGPSLDRSEQPAVGVAGQIRDRQLTLSTLGDSGQQDSGRMRPNDPRTGGRQDRLLEYI